MPKSSEVVSWDLFKWIVSGLLVVVMALVGLGFRSLTNQVSDLRTDLRTNISDLRTDLRANTREVSDLKIASVTAISGVREQVAVTNTKLDSLIQEIQRLRGQNR